MVKSPIGFRVGYPGLSPKSTVTQLYDLEL